MYNSKINKFVTKISDAASNMLLVRPAIGVLFLSRKVPSRPSQRKIPQRVEMTAAVIARRDARAIDRRSDTNALFIAEDFGGHSQLVAVMTMCWLV